jgi:hypothetical protein
MNMAKSEASPDRQMGTVSEMTALVLSLTQGYREAQIHDQREMTQLIAEMAVLKEEARRHQEVILELEREVRETRVARASTDAQTSGAISALSSRLNSMPPPVSTAPCNHAAEMSVWGVQIQG